MNIFNNMAAKFGSWLKLSYFGDLGVISVQFDGPESIPGQSAGVRHPVAPLEPHFFKMAAVFGLSDILRGKSCHISSLTNFGSLNTFLNTKFYLEFIY